MLLAATDATVSVGDSTAAEGATESFTVTLPGGPVSQDVVVSYETADGKALAGVDYTATSGTAGGAAGHRGTHVHGLISSTI